MKSPSNHIIIAGTGRTGTSFLVRYLAELGLDTRWSRDGTPDWDDDAQAGLEDHVVSDPIRPLPYVIKSPWISEYVDQLLARDDIAIDCAILPVRDLITVAASRTILELRARFERASWLTKFDPTWDTWGCTPGGTVFSLNPLDQARILAMGFHRLIERLTQADVPMVFLAFPRFAQSWEYLHGRLENRLPIAVTPEQARAAHARVADLDKVRVEKELGGEASVEAPAVHIGAKFPRTADLEPVALRREIDRLRRENERLAVERADWQARVDSLTGERTRMVAESEQMGNRAADLRAKLDFLLASRSWRLTSPLRAMARAMGGRAPDR